MEKDRIQHYRTIERRHMIRVKDALAAGLERRADDPAVLVACVDYLEFIVGRFVAQGRGNVGRLREAIPAADADSLRIVDDIEGTLDATRRELDLLVAARDTNDVTPESIETEETLFNRVLQ